MVLFTLYRLTDYSFVCNNGKFAIITIFVQNDYREEYLSNSRILCKDYPHEDSNGTIFHKPKREEIREGSRKWKRKREIYVIL